jgi:hypothetical protein
VSKFHPICLPIAQESSLGRKGWIFGEVHVLIDLPGDKVRSHRTMSDLTRTMSDLQFEFPETSQRTMSGPSGPCPPNSCSSIFAHCFGRILLTKCLFDLIFFCRLCNFVRIISIQLVSVILKFLTVCPCARSGVRPSLL